MKNPKPQLEIQVGLCFDAPVKAICRRERKGRAMRLPCQSTSRPLACAKIVAAAACIFQSVVRIRTDCALVRSRLRSFKDFALVREGAQGVTALVKGQHWFVLNTPEYNDYSKNMEQAAQRLVKAADNNNIEAAALRYFDLTLNCIDCHRYLETVGN
jgi:hypothetical protein